MGVLNSALWALNRPQQALFQGSQSGADANARAMTAMSNAGYGLPAQIGVGLANYVPAFLGGAKEGFLGQGRDLTGEDLTESRGLGAFLDLAADPSSLFGTGALKAPQAFRTLKNLKSLAGTPLEKMGKRLSVLDKLRTDAPLPYREGEPFYMIGDQVVGGLSGGFRKRLHGNPNLEHMSGVTGEYIRGSKGADTILSTRGTVKKTVPHETTHRELSRSPDVTAREISDYHDYAKKMDPEGFGRLERSYGHLGGNKFSMGDEYGAWATEGSGVLAPEKLFPGIAAAQKRALNAPKEVFKQAPGARAVIPFLAADQGRRGVNALLNQKKRKKERF